MTLLGPLWSPPPAWWKHPTLSANIFLFVHQLVAKLVSLSFGLAGGLQWVHRFAENNSKNSWAENQNNVLEKSASIVTRYYYCQRAAFRAI